MNRKTAPYGTYRDFPKIDIFRRTPNGPRYRGSTTWARTCREACDRYAESTGFPREGLFAHFDRG